MSDSDSSTDSEFEVDDAVDSGYRFEPVRIIGEVKFGEVDDIPADLDLEFFFDRIVRVRDNAWSVNLKFNMLFISMFPCLAQLTVCMLQDECLFNHYKLFHKRITFSSWQISLQYHFLHFSCTNQRCTKSYTNIRINIDFNYPNDNDKQHGRHNAVDIMV